jgi:Protein of unknown function (DUF3306)
MAGDEDFLSRWSRRKRAAKTPGRAESVPAAVAASPVPAPADAPAVAPPPATAEREPLPPVESLTKESDFAPFMAPGVDGGVRRQALKTLFSDPRFNVMDMMDVYVDDYSKPDPLPESWLAKMETVSRLGDRAGRDREEAERRKALEAAAGGDPGAARPDAVAEAPQAVQPAAPEAVAQPIVPDDAAPAANPPPAVRESGT